MSTPTIRDREIRTALRRKIEEVYRNDSDTLIIDELGLCEGDARIDVAVVNGSLTGYEIKSAADTLQRLPHQVDIYGRLLDEVTLVSSKCHLDKAKAIVPEWWGLSEATETSGQIAFEVVREPQQNPLVDPFAVVQLLWKDEALMLLKQLGLQKGMRGKARPLVWKCLSDAISLPELSTLVRQQLKARRNWRLVGERASYDDSCPPSSTSLNYPDSGCGQHKG
jgi:hypothetical protein